jgi:putative membrane protein
MKLSKAEHDRIAAAIAEVETKTSGEVFCILARRVSEYRETPVAWAAGTALILPLALVPFGFHPGVLLAKLPGFSGGWTLGHASGVDFAVGVALTAYSLLQVALFGIALFVFSLPPIRRLLTPGALKRERVRKAALEQFLAKGLHQTEGRTGVLIFASDAERRVEIVADEAIHSRVKPEVWAEAVAALTRGLRDGKPVDGFVDAIEHCGAVLAEHFPPVGENPNELPDKLVEL